MMRFVVAPAIVASFSVPEQARNGWWFLFSKPLRAAVFALRAAVCAALLICLAACVSPEPRPSVRAETFGVAHRAATALLTATDVGIAYGPFGESVRTFATEIELVRAKVATSEEKTFVERLDRALTNYKDSLGAWALKIEHGTIVSPLHEGIEALATKYGVEKGQQFGNYNAEEVLRAAWRQAASNVREAGAIYARGTEPGNR